MSRPILTGAEREAFERFPAEIGDRELSACLTLADGELATLGRLRGEHARAAVGLGVGALRWLGVIPGDLPDLPAPALDYVAE